MALYKRPGSKYYWMKFTFDGQLVQQSTKCKARRDAETVESAYRTQLALGKVGIKAKKKAGLFKAVAADYLAWSELHHAQKPGTVNRIKYSVNSLIRHFGSKQADQIEKSDIERFVLARAKEKSRKTAKPVTSDTINVELTTLKTIFNRLVSQGSLHESPAKDVRPLPANKRTFHVLTPAEEKVYLLACPQPLQDLVTLILETGMRPIEIYTLTRQCVDLVKGWVKVTNGKTASSNRKVWLSERASAILERRLNLFSADYLFPTGDKDGLGPTHDLNDQHRTVRKAIGLSFRIYDCRHTFASRALESGIDLLTLANMLGHSSLDEVMRYAHPSENRKREAIIEMGNKAAKAV